MKRKKYIQLKNSNTMPEQGEILAMAQVLLLVVVLYQTRYKKFANETWKLFQAGENYEMDC